MSALNRRMGRPPEPHAFLGDPECSCRTCGRIADTRVDPGEGNHGTLQAWKGGCRCENCQEWFFAQDFHGHLTCYQRYHCRCERCREANAKSALFYRRRPALMRFLDYAKSLPEDDRRHPDHPEFRLPADHAWAAEYVFDEDDPRHPSQKETE